MQTFLPLPSFKRSARCLDNRRLGKQRVECKQILLGLGVPIGAHTPRDSRWRNHPAVRMWAGYEVALLVYGIVMCREWRGRGFVDNLCREFEHRYAIIRPTIKANKYPAWFGDPDFHASHRSNLLRKDPTHYATFGWLEPPNLPYIWPTKLETV